MTTNNSINKTCDTFTATTSIVTPLATTSSATGADPALRIGKSGFPQYSVLFTGDGTSYYSNSNNAADVAFLRSASGKLRISDATLTGSATLEVNNLNSFGSDLTITPSTSITSITGKLNVSNYVNTNTVYADGTGLSLGSDNSTVTLQEGNVLRFQTSSMPNLYKTLTASSGSLALDTNFYATGLFKSTGVTSGNNFFEGWGSSDTNARAVLFSQGTNAGGLFLGAGNSSTGGYVVYNGSAGTFSFSQNSDKTGAATLSTHAGTIDAQTYQNSSSTFTLDGTNLVLGGSTGIKFPTSGGTAAALNYYESSGTVSETWSGIWASPLSGDITFTRIGNQVTLAFYFGSATANTASNITAANALPTRLRPAGSQVLYPIQIIDNGTNKFGFVAISTSGVVVIYAGAGVTNFAGAGDSGLSNRVTVTYLTS